MQDGPQHLERFERTVVFRVARALPLAFAMLATAGVALAVVAAGFSLVPAFRPGDPRPADVPPPVAISAGDVTNYLAAIRNAQAAQPATQPVGGAGQRAPAGPLAPSADAVSVAEHLDAVRSVALTRGLPWEDLRETVCESLWGQTCFRYGERVIVRGVGPMVVALLGAYDTADTREVVTVGGGENSYRVNSSNAGEKVIVLQELASILRDLPQPTSATVEAWATLRQEREQERRNAIAAEEARVLSEAAEAELAYQAKLAARSTLRRTAMMAGLAGLVALLTAGLLLAVLAIERNTRAIGQLALELAPASRPPDPAT